MSRTHLFILSLFVISAQSALAQTASWSTPADLSLGGQLSSNPQVACSSDGSRVTAIWRRFNGSNEIIQSASGAVTGNSAVWGTVTDLSAAGQSAVAPQIAVSSDGTKAIAVWSRNNGAHTIIQTAAATVSDEVASWGAVSDLSQTLQNAFGAQIALSSDGTRATAIWVRNNGSANIVQSASATVSGNTAVWGTVTDLSAVGQNAGSPQIALSADGTDAVAVWYRFDGTNDIIQAASATILGNSATWGLVSNLSAAGGSASSPHVRLSSDGAMATAVWSRFNGSNTIIQSASATVADETSNWGAVANLSTATRNAINPRVGLSSDGSSATVVWQRNNGFVYIVQSVSALISGNTASWGTIRNLSAAGAESFFPKVVVSSDGGSAIAAWYRHDGSNLIVQSASASLSGNTASFGPTYDLSATGEDATSAQLASSYDGRKATVVWTRALIQSASATLDYPTPTPTRTATATATATATVTVTATATVSPTATGAPVPTSLPVSLTATPTPAVGNITGTVVDAEGSPVPMVVVYAFRAKGYVDASAGEMRPVSALTNGSGEFRLEGLPTGSYRVVPRMTGFSFEPSEVVVNAGVRVPVFTAREKEVEDKGCKRTQLAPKIVAANSNARRQLDFVLSKSAAFAEMAQSSLKGGELRRYLKSLADIEEEANSLYARALRISLSLPTVALSCRAKSGCLASSLEDKLNQYRRHIDGLRRASLSVTGSTDSLKGRARSSAARMRVGDEREAVTRHRRTVTALGELPRGSYVCAEASSK